MATFRSGPQLKPVRHTHPGDDLEGHPENYSQGPGLVSVRQMHLELQRVSQVSS